MCCSKWPIVVVASWYALCWGSGCGDDICGQAMEKLNRCVDATPSSLGMRMRIIYDGPCTDTARFTWGDPSAGMTTKLVKLRSWSSAHLECSLDAVARIEQGKDPCVCDAVGLPNQQRWQVNPGP